MSGSHLDLPYRQDLLPHLVEYVSADDDDVFEYVLLFYCSFILRGASTLVGEFWFDMVSR